MGQNACKYLAEIGIGIQHGENRQRGDGKEGKGIAGLGGHLGFALNWLSGIGHLITHDRGPDCDALRAKADMVRNG